MRIIVTALLAAAALAGPAVAREKEAPEAAMAKLLAGRVAGKPQSCISLPRTGGNRVIDGTAILYREGGTWWVNRPRSGAESLDEDDILVTKTSLSQLCSLDVVDLIDRASRFPRGFVSLGDFVPYRMPAKR